MVHTVFGDVGGNGNDSSGNQNNFVSSGLAALDQMLDSPTNNWWCNERNSRMFPVILVKVI